MKERPMMFTGATVQAILSGRKTQTRRLVTPQPKQGPCHACILVSPFGFPGDRLWVKETWAKTYKAKHTTAYVYRADNPKIKIKRWKSSMFMPRRASRINLEITDIRMERLQDITDSDARAEGIYLHSSHGLYSADHTKMWGHGDIGRTPVEGYQTLWDALNAKRGFGWDKNPYVWVITFKRV